MAVRPSWYEVDSRFIPGHYQPAVLIDLALSREVNVRRLLRGTGIVYDDIVAGGEKFSPAQFLTLIGNVRRLLDADDTSFLFGQRLLPGHYGAASHALGHAANLRQALERLVGHRALLSPLTAPRLQVDENWAWLYWIDACGAGEAQRFLVEASMSAVAGMCRWLSGRRLPWQFLVGHARPRYIEQYWVHLGETVLFERHLDAMRIPRSWLDLPWPGAAQTAGQAAGLESARQLADLGVEASLLDRLYHWLLDHVREQPNLDRAALAFEMSPATLKRKLAKHGTHFQEWHDLVRKHVALYLYDSRGYTNEEVAAHLRFHDTTNFRRSFKRWTGFAPSSLKELWQKT
ncbi:AraC family transcriptional regulator [Zavarzinia compransoris]|uniref:AraC family transcriptional regulator n=1 Tax=Zavarzinia compransoris TaxID=1264899 RepID=A0A317E1I1_9PROT|nr:AraC family transcriptional regulator [Zavarzinia compransoris]PWR20918.1 AraC family transcriptional regulator [Zavarzinia compransoris]TDP44244.1 AraC family transcriptional regulator [Zavarzinia compransoris]